MPQLKCFLWDAGLVDEGLEVESVGVDEAEGFILVDSLAAADRQCRHPERGVAGGPRRERRHRDLSLPEDGDLRGWFRVPTQRH